MLAYLKHFIFYHLDRERFFYTILITAFVAISGIFYWVTLKGTRETLNDEFSNREQIVARSGSQSISEFINLLGKNISVLSVDISEDPSVVNVKDNLSRFMAGWGNTPASAILFADKDGKVVANENIASIPAVGSSVADLPYFTWAKKAKVGEYLITSPIVGTVGYTKGKNMIALASPVVVNGKFSGVVRVAIVLTDLANPYLNSLKFTENTRVYLSDEKGTILSSVTNTLIGVNYINYLSKISYKGQPDALNKFVNAISSPNSEGKFVAVLSDSLNQGKLVNYVVAYSKVKVGSSNWFLVVASPESEPGLYLWRVRNAAFGYFVFTLLMILLFSFIHLRSCSIREQKRY
jgi:C4-dicarboxylate-specific signal transduction histidine kinase